MFSPHAHVSVCLSVCLCARYSRTRPWIWMKCYVSTNIGTWANGLTFETDPDHSPDAGTGLLPPISYRLRTLQPCLVYLRQRRRYMFSPACPRSFVCLSVCLCARLLKNACMDLDEMLHVDRCRDMDELINF